MSALDWMVIIGYLGGTIAFGMWFGRRQDNLEDYFLGGRAIPWWAALLSMVATEISAATFLGAPEQGYIRDMTYLQFSVGTILARFVLAALFLGAFYRFRVFTVYGFLTLRFGPATQTSMAGVFLLGRLLASGARLFIAAIAINVATGLSMSTSIAVLGIAAIVYTWFGGIKAVIWTDVAQAVVLLGGGVIVAFSLLGHIPMGLGEILERLAQAGKFRLFDLNGASIPTIFCLP
jgi:SSS family solute:Na+ symporter